MAVAEQLSWVLARGVEEVLEIHVPVVLCHDAADAVVQSAILCAAALATAFSVPALGTAAQDGASEAEEKKEKKKEARRRET